MRCWKPLSDQRWQIELRFSIWRFSEQFFFVNNHLQCYWPIIHNSISKICPKFQVLGFHFFKVDEQWAKIVLIENISTPTYVKSDKMYWSKVCVKNSGIACLALIFNLSNPRSTILHEKSDCRLQNTSSNIKSNIPVFFIDWHESMAEWLRQNAESQAAWVRFPLGAETLCSASAILRGNEPVSALTRALLYCCALYNFSLSWMSSVAISLWQGFKS